MGLIRELINNPNHKGGIERCYYQCEMSKAGQYWMAITEQYIDKPKKEPNIKDAWNNTILWALGNPKCKIDLLKGIGLVGRTGSGKTITMHILNDFIKIDEIKYKRGKDMVNLKFKMESALVIASEYAQQGDVIIQKYSNFANLCIDDLGAENSEKSYFGNKVNVIQEIIENRYNNGLMIHFTSNLNMDLIQKTYGDRVYSRLYDACNVLTLNDCDFRLLKNK